MTNLTETSNWDAAVYQIATTDAVLGGPGGIANLAPQSLVDRSLWIRNRIAAAINQAGLTDGTSDNQQLAEAVVLQVPSVPALRLNTPIPTVPGGQTVMVMTRGNTAPNDGLSTLFSWNAASTAADDGVTVVKPAGATGPGRWLIAGINAAFLGGEPASFYVSGAALSNYVTTTALASALSSYVTATQLGATLANYVTTAVLGASLANYVLTSTLTADLANYVTNAVLAANLANYATITFATGTGAVTSNSIWFELPNTFIHQAGTTGALSPGANRINFPHGFPHACIAVNVTPNNNSATYAITAFDANGFNMNTGAGEPFCWSADGW